MWVRNKKYRDVSFVNQDSVPQLYCKSPEVRDWQIVQEREIEAMQKSAMIDELG